MRKKLHLIYITGIGDSRVGVQRTAVRLWPLWGVEAELFQVCWAGKELWATKLARLTQRIDDLHAEGKNVCLVGISAGASAAINAYALRQGKVFGVVLIAGKVNRLEAIGELYYREDPAFIESVAQCEASLQKLDGAARRRILSRFALYDGRVSKEDSIIEGARNRRVFAFGHIFVIASQIVFGVPSFARFLKQLPQKA